MAGYVFAISRKGSKDFFSHSLPHGVFAPLTIPIGPSMTLAQKKRRARILAATYGDMVTMNPGDNIYFLSERKIYGTGTAVRIGPECKYDNYADASALLPARKSFKHNYLTNQKDPRARWVCLFEPSPHFFKEGVDMDDVLRFRPQAFRALRAFEGVSFIKIDDEENRALREYISLSNEDAYDDIDEHTFPFDQKEHERIKLAQLTDYIMDISKSLRDKKSKKYVESEMLIESRFMQKLRDGMPGFGKWDYLTHQLIASPFKPLRYIDKIDVFGYQFSPNYKGSPELITKYLLVELKNDPINKKALSQTMRYVDWICAEYASGDYSRIEAYVIGNRTVRGVDKIRDEICSRSYIREMHSATPARWNNLKLVHYSIDDDITFQIEDT